MGETEKKAKNIPFPRLKIITAADPQKGLVLILQVAQPKLARIFCCSLFQFFFFVSLFNECFGQFHGQLWM